MNIYYKQSKEFLRDPCIFQYQEKPNQPLEPMLLQYILKNSQKGNPTDVINKIDEFCMKHWMMNLGPEKGYIARQKGFHQGVTKVIQIGGYCGYSALVFANQIKHRQGAKVYSVEINKYYAGIAHKIHQHAGLANIIQIIVGTVQSAQAYIKKVGPFHLIFIDHVKNLYFSDLKRLEACGGVIKGTVVIGDNIITPGAPEYLANLKASTQYESTLYHTYLEYSNHPDGLLISIKR